MLEFGVSYIAVIACIFCTFYVVRGGKKKVPVVGVMIAITCLLIVTSLVTSNKSDVSDEDLLKTVAHIDLSKRADLELVSIDYKHDIAYYRFVQPEYNVQIGDTVYLFNGVEATLTSVDAVGFTFESDCDLIGAGLSGTAILTEDGTQIGYLSSRLANGRYWAIWN